MVSSLKQPDPTFPPEIGTSGGGAHRRPARFRIANSIAIQVFGCYGRVKTPYYRTPPGEGQPRLRQRPAPASRIAKLPTIFSK